MLGVVPGLGLGGAALCRFMTGVCIHLSPAAFFTQVVHQASLAMCAKCALSLKIRVMVVPLLTLSHWEREFPSCDPCTIRVTASDAKRSTCLTQIETLKMLACLLLHPGGKWRRHLQGRKFVF